MKCFETNTDRFGNIPQTYFAETIEDAIAELRSDVDGLCDKTADEWNVTERDLIEIIDK